MKITTLILAFTIFGRHDKAVSQIPNFEHNCTKKDSIGNPLIDSFTNKFDFVIAYKEQNSPYHNYKILSKRNKKWSYWTYSDNYLQLSKKTSGYKVDTVLTGTFWKGEKNINEKSVNELLSKLKLNSFWTLRNDSLNQTRIVEITIEEGDTVYKRDKGPTDQINYQFEVYKNKVCRVIKSYAPDYFVKKYKDMVERKKFIACRDEFLKWWKMYCR